MSSMEEETIPIIPGRLPITWPINLKERMAQFLELGFESDLTLVFASEAETQQLKVHRAILMAGSPQFNSILSSIPFTSSLQPLTVEIQGDPRLFKMIIKHIYTGESGVEVKDALSLLALAKIYKLDDLVTHCNELLNNEPTDDTVLQVFSHAMKLSLTDLIATTLDYICKNAAKLFTTTDWENLELNCLIEILKQGELCLPNELAVFNAALKWGESECLRQGLDPSVPKSLRSVLEVVLPHIRFPNIDPADFALSVATKSILNETELISLMICFLVPQPIRCKLPAGRFVSRPRVYTQRLLAVTQQLDNLSLPESRMQQTGAKCTVSRVFGSEIMYSKFPAWGKKVCYSSESLIISVSHALWLLGLNSVDWDATKFFTMSEYDFTDFKVNIKILQDDGTIVYEKDHGFGYSFSFENPLLIQSCNMKTKIVFSFVGNLGIRDKDSQADFRVSPAEELYFPIVLNCQASSSFNASLTPKTFDESVTISFSKNAEDDSGPIEEGFIQSLVFQAY